MKICYRNKNILITGSSKGIGKAIAEKLAMRGANLFLVARDDGALIETQQNILSCYPNIICNIYSADVSDHYKVKEAVRNMIDSMGSIHGLINNAGCLYSHYFEQTPIEVFQKLMSVNFMGSVYFTKEVMPFLQPGSFVSFTSSIVGYMGIFGYSGYSASKFALNGFAETLRQEFMSKQIQVSVLCPPDTETPGLKEEDKYKPRETRLLSKQANLMKPEEVAEKFLSKLSKGEFLINVNIESIILYRLHNWAPGFVQKCICWLIKNNQRRDGKKLVTG